MAYIEQENTPSRYFIDEMVRCFSNQEVICGIEIERGLAHQFIDTISLDEINNQLRHWLKGPGQVVQLVCNQEPTPSEAEFECWVQEAMSLSVEPPEEEESQRKMRNRRRKECCVFERDRRAAQCLFRTRTPLH